MSTQAHVIEEATKLFIKSGIRAVRMDDIAAHLGMSKRTLYEMFQDKEHLVTECLHYYQSTQDAANANRMLHATNLIEEFIATLDNWDTIETDFKLIQELKLFYPRIHERMVQERHVSAVQKMKKKVEAGIQEGLFLPHINIDLAVTVFSNSAHEMIVRPETFLSSGVSMCEAFKYISLYFLRGISTEEGIHIIDTYLSSTSRQPSDL